MIGQILQILLGGVLGFIAFLAIGLLLSLIAAGGGGGVRDCRTDNIDWDEYDKVMERLHRGSTKDEGDDE